MAATSLADRLKRLRSDTRKSQDEVADAVGISRPYLAGLETEQDRPGLQTLIALANYYGVSADWLASGEGDPQPSPLQDRTARLVALFEALPQHDQETLEDIARSLSRRRAER